MTRIFYLCVSAITTLYKMLSVFVVSLLLGVSHAAEIHSLPGLASRPNFRQFSDFFNVTATHRLHYWLNKVIIIFA